MEAFALLLIFLGVAMFFGALYFIGWIILLGVTAVAGAIAERGEKKEQKKEERYVTVRVPRVKRKAQRGARTDIGSQEDSR